MAPDTAPPVSQRPANDRVIRSFAASSSSVLKGRLDVTSRNSLSTSCTDSFVLSVCTGAQMIQGRWPRASKAKLPAP